MKTTIIIMSDPKTGSDEALGRVFNGLAAAYDFKEGGDSQKTRLSECPLLAGSCR